MSRWIGSSSAGLFKSEVPEPLKASGEDRVIGDREAQPEETGQRPEEPFGLAEREAKGLEAALGPEAPALRRSVEWAEAVGGGWQRRGSRSGDERLRAVLSLDANP